MELRMERVGHFEVKNHGATPTQCGKLGTLKFRYRVMIYSNSRALDVHGFIVDQLAVHNYFVREWGTRSAKAPLMSCERMAMYAAAGIGQFTGVHRVDVTIWGSKAAGLTAIWRRWGDIAGI